MNNDKLFRSFIVPLIVIILFIYITYINIKPFGGTEIFKIDVGQNDILYPQHRISNQLSDSEGLTYRELNGSLVYFDVKEIPRVQNIIIKIKFKDTLPPDTVFKIGGKDELNWHYKFVDVYKKESSYNDSWIIKEANFNATELYVQDDKYNFVLYLEHLNKKDTASYTIPIDWIEVKYLTPKI